jgi:hypothetical protein
MKETIAHIHILCEDWNRELLFFKDELPIFKHRLNEVASKNTSSEIMKEVEHFENKFKLMELHIDEMLHDTKLKNEQVLEKASVQSKFINVKMMDSVEAIENQMHMTSDDFYSTKKEFYKFLAKVF